MLYNGFISISDPKGKYSCFQNQFRPYANKCDIRMEMVEKEGRTAIAIEITDCEDRFKKRKRKTCVIADYYHNANIRRMHALLLCCRGYFLDDTSKRKGTVFLCYLNNGLAYPIDKRTYKTIDVNFDKDSLN